MPSGFNFQKVELHQEFQVTNLVDENKKLKERAKRLQKSYDLKQIDEIRQ